MGMKLVATDLEVELYNILCQLVLYASHYPVPAELINEARALIQKTKDTREGVGQ